MPDGALTQPADTRYWGSVTEELDTLTGTEMSLRVVPVANDDYTDWCTARKVDPYDPASETAYASAHTSCAYTWTGSMDDLFNRWRAGRAEQHVAAEAGIADVDGIKRAVVQPLAELIFEMVERHAVVAVLTGVPEEPVTGHVRLERTRRGVSYDENGWGSVFCLLTVAAIQGGVVAVHAPRLSGQPYTVWFQNCPGETDGFVRCPEPPAGHHHLESAIPT